MVLCGVRDIRDCRIRSSTGEVIAGGSSFNVAAKSLRMGDFTEAETRALMAQHTEETGQRFTAAAQEAVWTQTRGQPWLVNALCAGACFTLDAETGQDVGLRLVGNTRLAMHRDRMDEYHQYAGVARTIGVDVEFLTPGEVGEIWPLCNIDGLIGANPPSGGRVRAAGGSDPGAGHRRTPHGRACDGGSQQSMLVAAEDLSNAAVVWTAVGDDEPDFAMTIAICGTVGGASGAEALDAMLAALADRGPECATWTEGGIGLGRRGAPSPEPDPSGRTAHPFPVDHGAGLVVAADARLDDRDALCDALGVPLPERAGLADAELILRAFMRWGRTARTTCSATMPLRSGTGAGARCSAPGTTSAPGPSITR